MLCILTIPHDNNATNDFSFAIKLCNTSANLRACYNVCHITEQ